MPPRRVPTSRCWAFNTFGAHSTAPEYWKGLASYCEWTYDESSQLIMGYMELHDCLPHPDWRFRTDWYLAPMKNSSSLSITSVVASPFFCFGVAHCDSDCVCCNLLKVVQKDDNPPVLLPSVTQYSCIWPNPSP